MWTFLVFWYTSLSCIFSHRCNVELSQPDGLHHNASAEDIRSVYSWPQPGRRHISKQSTVYDFSLKMATAEPHTGVKRLATEYSSCVKSWGYISGHLSQEFAMQNMKLDIEKTIFLLWGRRVGIITGEDEDEAVLDPRISMAGDTQKAVFNAIFAIKNLLTDSDELRLKYGLIVEDQPTNNADNTNEHDRLSRSHMSAFESWQGWIQMQQNDTSAGQKKRWVCTDLDKLVAFINEINYLNAKLQSLPPATRFFQDLAISKGVSALHSDLPALRLVIAASENLHKDWYDASTQQMLSMEPSSPTIQSREDVGSTSGLEQVHSWRESITPTETVPQQPNLIMVEDDVLKRIQRQVEMCSGLSKFLKSCYHVYYVKLGKSDVCGAVKRSLEIQRAKLKDLKFSPSNYEVLKIGLGGWETQCRQVHALVQSKPRDMGGFWSNAFNGNVTLYYLDQGQGAKELEAAIRALDTSLESVINSAR
jgi:Prion-inhibition and propagation